MSSIRIIIAILSLLFTIFVSVKIGVIILLISMVEFLYYSGVFTKTKFSNWILNDSDIFYLEYKGKYKNIGKSINVLCKIAKKYHLDKRNWSTFGFYYDNPQEVKPENCRAAVGLMYFNEKDLPVNHQLNNNIFNDLIKEGLEYNKIIRTNCLVAKYPYVNFLSFFSSMIKFYKNLKRCMSDDVFLKKHSIEVQFKYSIEIYREKEVIFAIPLENCEQFFIYTGQNDYKSKKVK